MTEFHSEQAHGGGGGYNAFSVGYGEQSNEPIACRRCRKQKLRCSKEKPTCKRCQSIPVVCTYPLPPDRRLLATQRARNRKPHICREPEDTDFQGQQTSSHVAGPDSALQETATLSPKMALLLIEIYFSRHWNAELMIHKASFIYDYLLNKVPDFLSLSIFALASNFLRQTPQRPFLDEDHIDTETLQLAATYSSSHAQEWATAAGQQALSCTDKPSLETIQACQNLSFYWFYQGDTDRANFYTTTAYRACRLLRFHCQPASDIDPLLAEVKRRCFWSCWITNCISQDNANFKAESWKEVVGLPLPSGQTSFLDGKPDLREVFAPNGDVVPINDEHSKSPPPSIMGELVKVFGLWWEIQHFVKQHLDNSHHDPLNRLPTFLALDRHLEIFLEKLHPEFRFGLSSSTPLKTDPYRLFSLHCIYHLCACILHSSIVPVFSGVASDPQISKRFTRMSAKEAIKHSTIIIDMATTFLNICTDVTRLSGITGYALFVSSFIQFKSLSAQGKLQSHGISRCNAAILMLQHLKEYSRPLQEIWTNLSSLFSSENIKISNLSTGNGRKDGALDPNTDIGQIVSQKPISRDSASNIDLYTYVASVESSSTSPQGNIQETQSAADILRTMKQIAGRQETGLSVHARHTPLPGPSSASNYHISAPNPQPYHALAPPLQPQVFGGGVGIQEVFDKPTTHLNSRNPSTATSASFTPISAATEGAGFQFPIQGQGEANMMNMNLAQVAMETDGANGWWEQRIDEFETDLFGFLRGEHQWSEGGNYVVCG